MCIRDRAYGDVPVLIAGDFNLPPCYADLRRTMAGFQDTFARRGSGWGKTVPAKLPLMRIDMVYAPAQATVYHARALPTRFSDHRPVVVELEVPLEGGRGALP